MDIYEEAFKIYGESPASLHWINYPSMGVRFKHLVAELDLENKSILDAGCGMGDLLPFIYAKADNFDYLGVDKNADFIAVAQKRYGGHKFKVADPFFGRLRQTYDVVLCSGVMNQNIPGWLDVRKQMIKQLFKLAGQTLAFNMAGSFSYIPADDLIAYADAQDIYDFCEKLSENVTIKTGYSNYDFTIIMRR